MTTSYSCRCNFTMMIKNYKINTPIEFLSQSHKSTLSFFSLKTGRFQSPYTPKRAIFFIATKRPKPERKIL